MYASLPLSCPSRVVCDAARGLGDAEVEDARDAVGRRRGRSAATRRGGRCSSGSPCSLLASCAACRPCEHAAMMVAHDAAAIGALVLRGGRAQQRRESDSPCTYSMTRSTVPLSATTSSVGTTLGWRMRAARRASSRNIETNSGSLANCGCSRLMATARAKPRGPDEPAEVHGRHAARRDLVVDRVPIDLRRRLTPRVIRWGRLPRARYGSLPPPRMSSNARSNSSSAPTAAARIGASARPSQPADALLHVAEARDQRARPAGSTRARACSSASPRRPRRSRSRGPSPGPGVRSGACRPRMKASMASLMLPRSIWIIPIIEWQTHSRFGSRAAMSNSRMASSSRPISL